MGDPRKLLEPQPDTEFLVGGALQDLAESGLGTSVKMPRSETSADHAERTIHLSELFVGLLDPTSRGCPFCSSSVAWRLAKWERRASAFPMEVRSGSSAPR